MTNWRQRIDLNGAIARANEAHDLTRVEESPPAEVVEMLCRELEKSEVLRRHVKPLRACLSIAALNRRLSLVFDDADRGRVWCGMRG